MSTSRRPTGLARAWPIRALKTADSGYLTRKLADICQNMVITQHDCGTTQGVTREVLYRGESVEVSLRDAIVGRVARDNIVDLITGETVVRENELITESVADRIEEMSLKKIQVRSPMTCESQLGLCRLCYGMDRSTGSMVEEGLAAGIIAAQSIGEPGTQLTMRTFHIGGAAQTSLEESEIHARRSGRVKYTRLRSVTNAEGKEVSLTRNGEIILTDEKGRELETYPVPTGATLTINEGEMADEGQVLCEWDPHSVPVLAEVGRQGPLRRPGGGRHDPQGEGEVRQHPPHRHRAQRRPAPADRAGGRRGQDPRLLLPARTGQHRRQRGRDGEGRHRARPEPAGLGRHAGHHRRSAAGHRAVRSPDPQGPRGHRGGRRRSSSSSRSANATSGSSR